jgi:redox-sensitive bicupin YhaK (pirin superfamily)
VQLWIALPEAQRHGAPAFRNYPQLPCITQGGFSVRVLAGNACGATSPVEVHSPLVGLDISATAAARTSVPLAAAFEHAALALSGTASIEGETLTPGTLLYLGSERERLAVSCTAAAHIMLLGGTPFGEDVLLWWNFVARNLQEIEEATRDWNTGQRFGTVRGSPSPPLVAPDLSGVRLRSGRTGGAAT